MPKIRQEGVGAGIVKTVAGLPLRWGRRAYAALKDAEKLGVQSQEYRDLCALLDAITAAPVPIDATDAQLCMMAERFAADCAGVPVAESAPYWPAADVPGDGVGPREYAERAPGLTERERMESICRVRGVEPPSWKFDDAGAMARMVDAAWWRASLRRVHGRLFEHAAMRLAFVSSKAGSYCSNETVKRRREQNERNTAALKAAILANEQGQEFTLYDLAQKGMGNKANRKDELMVRMAGCEDVAKELGHVGLFVTLTCPSRFHAVLQKTGTFNPKYGRAGCPTPRQAQDYLNGVWARTRAQNARDGIAPYGFRIAEPHHDGCPHWHMLVFLPESDAATFSANLARYALAEDADELQSDSAKEARLKIIRIDPAKGTAAGYIAKYVGKNIDDSQGAAFDEEGAVLSEAAPPCARVDAWASVWGIRQFQGLGMPPVTVWRELRRVKDDAPGAPEYLRAALAACQKRTCKLSAKFCEEPAVIHAANFGAYIRAQGGVNVGRAYRIGVAAGEELVAGRYGVIPRMTPVGVEARAAAFLGFVGPVQSLVKSKRYQWTKAGRKAAGVAVPWTRLNNCTGATEEGFALADVGPGVPAWWIAEQAEPAEFVDPWWGSDEMREFLAAPEEIEEHFWANWHAANEREAQTVYTLPGYFVGPVHPEARGRVFA